ncbi:MAG: alpha/beta fold hydrolase [Hyphomicrobium sp.]|nr:alpha/beta fold hydrolase [Hyphomicrobium sp.]
MTGALEWERDGKDWPGRDQSRFVHAGGVTWRVEVGGTGPVMLMLHGTGASSHSWHGMRTELEPYFTVVAPDLPGHAFSRANDSAAFSLPGMARAVGALIEVLGLSPDVIVGHSAGAAVAMRMAIDGAATPRAIVSVNGALFPYGGAAAQFFSPLARLLVVNPIVPHVFAWRAGDRSAVERLIRGTGSEIPAESIERYARLFQSPGHVAATLSMMARWDLVSLQTDLPRLAVPLHLIVGGADTAVSPEEAFQIRDRLVRDRLGSASIDMIRGLGHLAHEEEPVEIAKRIRGYLQTAGVRTAAV